MLYQRTFQYTTVQSVDSDLSLDNYTVATSLECQSDVLLHCVCGQDCGSSDEDFRKWQCAQTDSIPMNGQTHHWIPVSMLGEWKMV